MWATLTADGRFDIHDPETGLAPTLDQMQAIVDAGNGRHYVERVQLKHAIDMWVNEEGLYAWGTPPPAELLNDRAKMLANAAQSIMAGTPIVGNVVFTGGANEEGDTLGLSGHQLEYLRQVERIQPMVEGVPGFWNMTGVSL